MSKYANIHTIRIIACILLPFVLASCGGSPPPSEIEASDTPSPIPITEEPATVTATLAKPTASEIPLPAFVVGNSTAEDGCLLVQLNPDEWQPLFTSYNSGSDPFFQIHTQEAEGTFFFGLELYTVFGPSWTGQLGTFSPSCNDNGLCVYLVPDAANSYWASAGDMEIVALSEEEGFFELPLLINFTNLTMSPVPGTTSPGCYHIDTLSVYID